MVHLLRMLEHCALSLSDAEAGGVRDLALAVQRCQRCADADACSRWLKWHGRYGRAPLCLNADYFDRLRQRSILS